MKKVIFAKYNQSRNPMYQTVTRIIEDGEKKYIEKEALTKEALSHIRSFDSKYEMTKSLYNNIDFLSCETKDNKVLYDYVIGKSIDESIFSVNKDLNTIVADIHSFLERYLQVSGEYRCEFTVTEEYQRFFGNISCDGMECIRPVNLDVIFDNLFVSESGVRAIDYEWVYDMAVPEKYVQYRILSRFYDKYFSKMSSMIDFDQFVYRFGITEEEFKVFFEMETSFIHHIYSGGEDAVIDKNYLQKTESMLDIIKKDELLDMTKEQLDLTKEQLDMTKEQLNLTREQLEQSRQDFKIVCCEADLFREDYLRMEREYFNVRNQLVSAYSSRSWKLTKPVRAMAKLYRGFKYNGKKAFICKLINWCDHKFIHCFNPGPYNHRVSKRDLKHQKKVVFDKQYKISIITPFFNTDECMLRELLDSLQEQTYANWELCAVDFSSADNDTVERVMGEYRRKDSRIIYKRDLNNQGISENTNKCIELASGEYIAMLDHDDVLHPSAFFEVMKVINEDGSDFIYTDEVKFEGSLDNLFSPNFKPDFSEDQLRTQNYICHLNVYKKTLLDKVGLYNPVCNGSQDHDMVLRLTEVAEHITHIPKLLYYWRVHSLSVAANIGAKPYATYAGIRAINQQLERKSLPGYVESIRDNIPCYRRICEENMEEKISLVIWGSGDRKKICSTLREVKDKMYGINHVSVVTSEGKTAGILDDINDWDGIYIERDADLSSEMIRSILINQPNEFVLFIRAGICIETEEFGNNFLMYIREKHVAAVDARLNYLGGRIFSAGVVASQRMQPMIQFRNHRLPGNNEGYENDLIHLRAVSAVSGLFTMISKSTWLSLPEPETKNCNGFIAQSLMAHKSGVDLLWNPEIVASDDFRQYDAIFNQYEYVQGDIPVNDPFYNYHIREFGLETGF